MKDGKLNNNNKILFVLFLFITFCSCSNNFDYGKKATPTQTIEQFVITETQNGKIKTVLNSPKAIIKEKEQIALLTEPVVKFYENGKYKSTLTAQEGEISLDTNNVFAKGRCTLETVDGEYLQTSDVYYDHLKEIVHSTSTIKITKGKDVVYGKGFESDINLKNIVIKNEKIIID